MQRFRTPAVGSAAHVKIARQPSSSNFGFNAMHFAIKDNAESRTMGDASVAQRRITRMTEASLSRRLGSFSSMYITLFKLRLRTLAWSLAIELSKTLRIVSKALQNPEFKTVRMYANLPCAVGTVLNCLGKESVRCCGTQQNVLTCASRAITGQRKDWRRVKPGLRSRRRT